MTTKNANVSFTDLVNIKRKLKKGEQTEIANRTGFSNGYVSKVLNGDRNNEAVIATAKAITRRRK